MTRAIRAGGVTLVIACVVAVWLLLLPEFRPQQVEETRADDLRRPAANGSAPMLEGGSARQRSVMAAAVTLVIQSECGGIVKGARWLIGGGTRPPNLPAGAPGEPVSDATGRMEVARHQLESYPEGRVAWIVATGYEPFKMARGADGSVQLPVGPVTLRKRTEVHCDVQWPSSVSADVQITGVSVAAMTGASEGPSAPLFQVLPGDFHRWRGIVSGCGDFRVDVTYRLGEVRQHVFRDIAVGGETGEEESVQVQLSPGESREARRRLRLLVVRSDGSAVAGARILLWVHTRSERGPYMRQLADPLIADSRGEAVSELSSGEYSYRVEADGVRAVPGTVVLQADVERRVIMPTTTRSIRVEIHVVHASDDGLYSVNWSVYDAGERQFVRVGSGMATSKSLETSFLVAEADRCAVLVTGRGVAPAAAVLEPGPTGGTPEVLKVEMDKGEDVVIDTSEELGDSEFGGQIVYEGLIGKLLTATVRVERLGGRWVVHCVAPSAGRFAATVNHVRLVGDLGVRLEEPRVLRLRRE